MFVSDACLNKDTLVPLMHATADLIKANEREHIIHAKVILYSYNNNNNLYSLSAISSRKPIALYNYYN